MKTLVLGASNNSERVAYQAVQRLLAKGHEVEAIGLKESEIFGVKIQTGQPALEGIDTVTLYLNAERQEVYYDYILGLKPRRIIFNPGTENPAFVKMAREQGVEVEIACTLVMLSVGVY